jgi:hypothetical protein
METRLDRLGQTTHDETNAKRIAKRMLKHRKELTAFLWDKDLDGTNNAAEWAIRPAVVARKISAGSRSRNGANMRGPSLRHCCEPPVSRERIYWGRSKHAPIQVGVVNASGHARSTMIGR